MKLRILIAGLLIGVAAFAADSGAELFSKAMTQEKAAGNLEEAIKLYQQVAKEFSQDRALAAKALVAEARCYEKQGQDKADKATKLYEQVERDYRDQHDPAATASARLVVIRQSKLPAAATMTQRKIEMTGRSFGEGDTDGHRVVYMNRATGELIYGDLAGNSKRVIFRAKLNDLPGWSPSRDFSMVYLHFQLASDQPQIIALVNTDGTGYREIARLESQPFCGPSWSWDKRYLLCPESQDNMTRLVRISVADGKTRELLSLKSRRVDFVNFSPDGRFVAYEVPSPSDADPVSRIFVVPAEGGEPQLAYEERATIGPPPKLLDWTADGRYLAIASDLSGKAALHLLPVKDGKSAGAPIFVRYGDFERGAMTGAGGLIYRSVKPGGVWVVQIAPLDANGQPGVWKRLDLHLGNTTNPAPQWSGDGSQILYTTTNQDAGQRGGEVVHLQDLSGGYDREIYHALGRVFCIWAARQPKLFCSDSGAEKSEIISIAVDSGQIEHLHDFPASLLVITAVSRDDRSLYMFRLGRGLGDQGGEVLRWEIATGQETKLEQFSSSASGQVGPDERWIIRNTTGSIEIRPTSGGDWKTTVSLSKSFRTGQSSFTRDGNWLLYHDIDSAGKHGLFRIATTGGQPERLGDFPTNSGSGTLEISPDGSKVMVASGEFSTGYELWSLDNFVPPAPKP